MYAEDADEDDSHLYSVHRNRDRRMDAAPADRRRRADAEAPPGRRGYPAEEHVPARGSVGDYADEDEDEYGAQYDEETQHEPISSQRQRCAHAWPTNY